MFIIYYGFTTWALCDQEGDIVSCHSNEYEAENAQIKLDNNPFSGVKDGVAYYNENEMKEL